MTSARLQVGPCTERRIMRISAKHPFPLATLSVAPGLRRFAAEDLRVQRPHSESFNCLGILRRAGRLLICGLFATPNIPVPSVCIGGIKNLSRHYAPCIESIEGAGFERKLFPPPPLFSNR